MVESWGLQGLSPVGAGPCPGGFLDDIDDIYDGAPPPELGGPSWPAFQQALAPAAPPPRPVPPVPLVQTGPDPHLVEQVKSLCRVNPVAKAQWVSWCESRAQGRKDPNRHDTELLNRFFEAYNSGQIHYDPSQATTSRSRSTVSPCSAALRPAPVVVPPPRLAQGSELSEIVRTGQRASPAWKVAWLAFCDNRGARNYDPARHDDEFLLSYIEFLGSTGSTALQDGSQWDRPDAKRQRLGEGPPQHSPQQPPQQPPPQHPVVTPVEGLAHCVRELQKHDQLAKRLWAEFCDAHGNGVKDPSRHDELTLRAYFQYAGLPQPDSQGHPRLQPAG